MKMQDVVVVVALAALAWPVGPAAGQETQEDSPGILQAIALPAISEILRDRGIPVEEVETTIFGARDKGVPAQETAGFLEATARAVEEHGPIENFGAFVQAQLDAGLRGRELAQAIGAEHARRGIGKGNTLDSRGRGQGGPPRPGAAGRGQGQGRPDEAGRGQGGPGAGARDTTASGPGRGSPEPGDSAAPGGPPVGRDPGARRRDTVPDSARRGLRKAGGT